MQSSRSHLFGPVLKLHNISFLVCERTTLIYSCRYNSQSSAIAIRIVINMRVIRDIPWNLGSLTKLNEKKKHVQDWKNATLFRSFSSSSALWVYVIVPCTKENRISLCKKATFYLATPFPFLFFFSFRSLSHCVHQKRRSTYTSVLHYSFRKNK